MIVRRAGTPAIALVDRFLDEHLCICARPRLDRCRAFRLPSGSGAGGGPLRLHGRGNDRGLDGLARSWRCRRDTIRLANGLAARRGQPTSPALPVWEVFPPDIADGPWQ